MAQINTNQMLQVGTVLDHRYLIESYLASGGFGNTYVAKDTRLDTSVAIKEFFMRGINHRSPDGITVEISNEENRGIFKAQLFKFHREAKRISELRNDHIIHVSDLFEANGTSYYVMDLIDGSSLSEQINRQSLTEVEVRGVALQVLDALEAMHNAGLYHLDIKPANIIRSNRDYCTLIDFGASKQFSAEDKSTMSSTMAYTPGYAPLEQVAQQNHNIGPWTDFFALGATLYSLLTGKCPPEVDVDDIAPDGRNFPYPPNVSDSMRHAISTMMNASRRLRPQNVKEVRVLLILKEEEKKFDRPSSPKIVDEETKIISPSKVDSKEANATSSQLHKIIPKEESSQRKTDYYPPTEENIIKNLINNMVYVSGGTFVMGATPEQKKYAFDDEKPTHQVKLFSFSIGRYQVTQEEWEAVMGNNPSYFKGDKNPVERVSWDDCQEFIRKLNLMTGKKFRLPTEAEWEYAARGGINNRGYKYAGSSNIDSVAWHKDNSGFMTHPVGCKSPNELGLYDMSGNVGEWCSDWYDDYSTSYQTNPQGPSFGFIRVFRGGCWNQTGDCRVSKRKAFSPSNRYPDVGLRLAL